MNPRPNILFISIDSLRPDHMSVYGYEKETTPYLSEMAGEGVVCKNAFAASNWTGAAVTSMLTGRYPTRHGYTYQRYYLDADVPTLAQRLHMAGYRTGCFSNNLYITENTGLHNGFENLWYRGVLSSKSAPAKEKEKSSGSHLTARYKQMVPGAFKAALRDLADIPRVQKSLTRDDGAAATESALQGWLAADAGRPFFAFVHYQEPHSPYFPPKSFRKRFFADGWFAQWRYLEFPHIPFYAGHLEFTRQQMENYKALYDGEIAYLDWRLGRLFEWMREHNLWDNTLVVVTADHGECFGENGYVWHAFNLYDPLLHVPLLIRFPEWFSSGQVVTELIQSIDIMPTLLDGLNLAPENVDGISFLNGSRRTFAAAECDNPGKMIRRWLKRRPEMQERDFALFLRDMRCYRTATAKYVWTSDGQHEFYDLEQDPGEANNLDGRDGRARLLADQLQKWHSTLSPHVPDRNQPGFDKDTWEKLKALGYA
jgi:arylsulfatase A-like enzyme